MDTTTTQTRLIDCGDCIMAKTSACRDCIVTHIIDGPTLAEFSTEERVALDVLAGSGLVPRLRLVTSA
ncbi:MAG: hypothetical protein H6512_05155 [Acidimicrobiia bacterium]|nr:hypothetical protein [Acidimicrobiia bacterium]